MTKDTDFQPKTRTESKGKSKNKKAGPYTQKHIRAVEKLSEQRKIKKIKI